MKTVVLAEFVFRTKDEHIAAHGISSGKALQYYGGEFGVLINWTPNYHRIISSEKVRVDTKTQVAWTLMQSPLCKYIND